VTAGEVKMLADSLIGGDEAHSVFRRMVDALPAAIYTTDAQGRLTYFNPAAARLSGRAPVLGTDQWSVTWKMSRPDGTPLPHDRCPMAIALRGEQVPAGISVSPNAPTARAFWFTPHPGVLRDPEGRIVGGINLLWTLQSAKPPRSKPMKPSARLSIPPLSA